MPNPKGVNGHGEKKKPPDDVLKASLIKYREQKQSQDQKLASLVKDHGYEVSLRTLNRQENRLQIASARRFKVPIEQVRQAVVDEVQADLSRGNGPDFIQDRLAQQRDIHVGRDFVTKIMKEYFPEDFVKRFPGRRAVRQNRTPLQSLGPFREINGDGHEKLGRLALMMGELSIGIYGYKDKWGDKVHFLECYPETRTAVAGAHIFLDFVEKTGCIPIQLTTDKGSEVGYMHAFMTTLREVYAPDLDPVIFPPHVILPSTNNTPIEGFWGHLLKKTGINLKEYIMRGKKEYLFDVTRPEHAWLFYWIFVPLIQHELSDFAHWWNHHRVRSQVKKLMPSGHVPEYAMEHPEQFGAQDWRIPIPQEAVQRLRDSLEEENPSRDECFSWYPANFAQSAQGAYEAIGEPTVTLASAWNIFVEMSTHLH